MATVVMDWTQIQADSLLWETGATYAQTWDSALIADVESSLTVAETVYSGDPELDAVSTLTAAGTSRIYSGAVSFTDSSSMGLLGMTAQMDARASVSINAHLIIRGLSLIKATSSISFDPFAPVHEPVTITGTSSLSVGASYTHIPSGSIHLNGAATLDPGRHPVNYTEHFSTWTKTSTKTYDTRLPETAINAYVNDPTFGPGGQGVPYEWNQRTGSYDISPQGFRSKIPYSTTSNSNTSDGGEWSEFPRVDPDDSTRYMNWFSFPGLWKPFVNGSTSDPDGPYRGCFVGNDVHMWNLFGQPSFSDPRNGGSTSDYSTSYTQSLYFNAYGLQGAGSTVRTYFTLIQDLFDGGPGGVTVTVNVTNGSHNDYYLHNGDTYPGVGSPNATILSYSTSGSYNITYGYIDAALYEGKNTIRVSQAGTYSPGSSSGDASEKRLYLHKMVWSNIDGPPVFVPQANCDGVATLTALAHARYYSGAINITDNSRLTVGVKYSGYLELDGVAAFNPLNGVVQTVSGPISLGGDSLLTSGGIIYRSSATEDGGLAISTHATCEVQTVFIASPALVVTPLRRVTVSMPKPIIVRGQPYVPDFRLDVPVSVNVGNVYQPFKDKNHGPGHRININVEPDIVWRASDLGFLGPVTDWPDQRGQHSWKSSAAFAPTVTTIDKVGGVTRSRAFIPAVVSCSSTNNSHMWLNLGSVPQPFTWIIVALVVVPNSSAVLLDAGAPTPDGTDPEFFNDFSAIDPPNRTLMAVTPNLIQMSAGKIVKSSAGSVARPMVYAGVFNKGQSAMYAIGDNYFQSLTGDIGDGPGGEFILNRSNGYFANGQQATIAYMCIEYFANALTEDQIGEQANGLASDYHFQDYR